VTFTAMYKGVCPGCGDAIEPGEEAAYDEGVVVHADCAGRARVRVARKPAEVCTSCWLERPCPCDDERRAS
jgi:hypothetical protein